MVVRLYYSDGSTDIKAFTDDELFIYGFLDKENLTRYLEDKFDADIDYWQFTYAGNNDNLEIIDIREPVTKNPNNLKFNKEVVKFEFLDINSYEYNVAILGMDVVCGSYDRKILIVYEDDVPTHYYDHYFF